MSVLYCGRKPTGLEDLPKQTKESPEQSDQNGDCRWTTGSRRFGTAPTTIPLEINEVVPAISGEGKYTMSQELSSWNETQETVPADLSQMHDEEPIK